MILAMGITGISLIIIGSYTIAKTRLTNCQK